MHARVALPFHSRMDRPPVVLVHGLGVSSRYMVPTMRLLGVEYPVYAPDLPGVGLSDKPPRVLNITELADSLAQWLERNRLERPTLIANSIGCQVIVDLAARMSGRVGRIVLSSPTVDPSACSMTAQFVRLMRDALIEPPSLLLIAGIDYLEAGIGRAIQTFRYALRDPFAQKLPAVAVPALVVRGSRDPIVPQRWAEQVTALLPRGALTVIPGAPHGLNYSRPVEFSSVVRVFMEDADPPSFPSIVPRSRSAACSRQFAGPAGLRSSPSAGSGRS